MFTDEQIRQIEASLGPTPTLPIKRAGLSQSSMDRYRREVAAHPKALEDYQARRVLAYKTAIQTAQQQQANALAIQQASAPQLGGPPIVAPLTPAQQQMQQNQAIATARNYGQVPLDAFTPNIPTYNLPAPPSVTPLPGLPAQQSGATVQMSEMDRNAAAALQYIRDRALSDASQPFVGYSHELRVPSNPREQVRAEMLANEASDWLPYLQNALQANRESATPFLQEVEQYMNPYQKHVVDKIAALGNRNLTENILPEIEARFIGSGQFGSSRHADLANRAARDIQAEISDAQKQALYEGYGQAADIQKSDRQRLADMATAEAALGQSLQGQRLTDIDTLNSAADLKRGLEQQRLDLAHEEWMRKLAHPQEQTNLYASLVRGMPYTTNTYNYTRPQGPSMHRGDFRNIGMNMAGNLLQRGLPNLMQRWGQAQQHAHGGRVKEIGRALSRY